MPVVSKGDLRIDYADDGSGRPVVLVHSSVSGNRQWRVLTEELRDRYRVLAVTSTATARPRPGRESSRRRSPHRPS